MSIVQSGVQAISELIDTQWDVNDITAAYVQEYKEELIDTQWDVNLNECIAMLIESERINRYIVGCK